MKQLERWTLICTKASHTPSVASWCSAALVTVHISSPLRLSLVLDTEWMSNSDHPFHVNWSLGTCLDHLGTCLSFLLVPAPSGFPTTVQISSTLCTVIFPATPLSQLSRRPDFCFCPFQPQKKEVPAKEPRFGFPILKDKEPRRPMWEALELEQAKAIPWTDAPAAPPGRHLVSSPGFRVGGLGYNWLPLPT